MQGIKSRKFLIPKRRCKIYQFTEIILWNGLRLRDCASAVSRVLDIAFSCVRSSSETSEKFARLTSAEISQP